jgi:hypothetical protein
VSEGMETKLIVVRKINDEAYIKEWHPIIPLVFTICHEKMEP